MKKSVKIPDNVIRRLPKYLRFCEACIEESCDLVSSADIASAVDVSPSMVRHDLTYFGDYGCKGIGYSPRELKRNLESTLGLTGCRTAVIIGIGGIGRLMLESLARENSCCKLTAGFDIDKGLIGKSLHDVDILNVSELEAYLKRSQVDICIICTPDEIAREMAGVVMECGVRAILNLTNVDIPTPYNMYIENVQIFDSLMRLDYYVANSVIKQPC